MAVSASFHRNVLLLTQLVQPSDDFKKHFREGMFDKPNTAGFVHVSHYLLTTYDSDRFKKLIQWPVTCKKTEAKYRNDVKDYLIVVSAENSDVGFPPILASHLFHAGGSKFTIIMWKLSQVVVRTYMKREINYNVMLVPKPGVTSTFARKFIEQTNLKVDSSISTHCKHLSCMEETANSALGKESEVLSKIKSEIFEKEKSITGALSNAPVHPSIRKRLINVNDTEVIQMWKESINGGINYAQKQKLILAELENLSSKAMDVILSNSSETKVLDAKQYKRIDSSTISELLFPPEVQCLLYRLYKDDKLILNSYVLLFNALLNQLHQRLKVNTLDDFSKCLMQIEASCEDVKSVSSYFETFLTDIAKISAETQNALGQKNILHIYSDNDLPVMKNVLLMPSPLIKINTNCGIERNDLQELLQLTPVEGVYKSLFSRYERRNQNHPIHGSKLRENLLVSRINIDDSISICSSEKQTSRSLIIVPKSSLSTNRQTGKYSRLFSTYVKRSNSAANTSIMSIPCSSKANSTAIANAIGEMHNISELSLDITTKSLCSISGEFTTPEKCIIRKRNEPESATKEDANTAHSDMIKLRIPEIDEVTEVEITNNYNKGTVKIEQTKQKRRSIGDLVERYKKLLELNSQTSSPSSCLLEHENE